MVREVAVEGLVDRGGGNGGWGVDPGATDLVSGFVNCGEEAVGKEGCGGDEAAGACAYDGDVFNVREGRHGGRKAGRGGSGEWAA